jgi:hypothetical protein
MKLGILGTGHVATVLGVIGGLALLVFSLRYEHHRLTPVVLSSPPARRGDEAELT